MAELIEPFEREIRRPRRNDGISADGLSYRGVDDFGGLWGQAMQEYENRLQRSKIEKDAGRNWNMESAADIRAELLDPLTQRFGSGRQTETRAAAPRTYRQPDGSVIAVDDKMNSSVVYQAKPKVDDSANKATHRSAMSAVARAQEGLLKAATITQRKTAQELYDAAIQNAISVGVDPALYGREASATDLGTAPIPETRIPQSYMGGKLDDPFGTARAQPKRPTRAQAREYVKKYGAEAKSRLKAEGFDLSSYAD